MEFNILDIKTLRRLPILLVVFTLLLIFSIAIFMQPNPIELISDYVGFFFLGIAGAIAANSTGAGGGVVFVPSFDALGMQIDADRCSYCDQFRDSMLWYVRW
ncbi:hypothetical protein [Thalassotalea crassostreae]|uniref:hypothetical protein n=1 Tax=Thalassotalea crassostreae TaxID=1763536 RepID=UPI001300D7D5|nr:hypothetical protein [Thalassotalea crassostreae]